MIYSYYYNDVIKNQLFSLYNYSFQPSRILHVIIFAEDYRGGSNYYNALFIFIEQKTTET